MFWNLFFRVIYYLYDFLLNVENFPSIIGLHWVVTCIFISSDHVNFPLQTTVDVIILFSIGGLLWKLNQIYCILVSFFRFCI